MRNNKIILGLLFTAAGLVFTNKIYASGPPPPATGNPCFPPPCGIPLDGGISFLIAAGIAYGSKKVYNARKKP